MLIGTHQSMSYLEPISKWDRLFHFFSQAQEVDIETQYKQFGVRVFDIRLYVDKNMRICFKHGSILLKTFSVYDILGFLNKMGDCYAKITLELDDEDFANPLIIEKYRRFEEYCRVIEEIYPYITFFGGVTNLTGQILYRFAKNKHNLTHVSSMYRSHSSIKESFVNSLSHFFPRWFIKTRNKYLLDKILSDNSSQNYILMDFINR